METSTYSSLEAKTITIEDIKKIELSVQKIKEKKRTKISWFTRFMNKHGWHREYEIIVIDKEAFKSYYLKTPII